MSDKVPTSRYVETAERQIQDLLAELEAVMADRDSLRTRLAAHHVGDVADGGHCKMCDAALTSSEKEKA